MRAFIVSCLLGLTMAAPQGYNYQQHTSQAQFSSVPAIQSIEGQQVFQQSLQAPKVQQIFSGGFGIGAASSPAVNYNAAPQQNIYQQQPSNFGFNVLPQQQQHQQQQLVQNYNSAAGGSLVSKDIYVHVPPVDDYEERYQQPVAPVAPPRKHYRIVFIKAPTPAVNRATLRVQQAPTEEKTIIYVLTKKPDPIDLQAAFVEAAAKPPSKPEVFFIKYKTQEEAAHAQRTIQAQYDQLGGTTQVSDEGVAPITSVIGSLDTQRTTAASSTSGVAVNSGLSSTYLPANLRH